jgi:transposase InsO family protein
MNPVEYPKELRGRWYLQVQKHKKPVAEVCKIFGIARKTYYKWYKVDHAGRSARGEHPKEQPAIKLTREVKDLIKQEKLRTGYGPEKMRLLLIRRLSLKVSTTIIYRYYKRADLIFRPQKKLPWYEPLKEPVVPKKPGEVVQMDAKYIWQKGRRRYQRTFVDIYTGFQAASVTDGLSAQETIKAFQDAEKEFPFTILGIQSDNGKENRGDFHQHLGSKGVAHYFIPKASPTWDGAVERAHGVIDQEFYLNPRRPWKSLPEYLRWYNYERIHLGKYLQGKTPAEKLLEYKLEHP